MRILLASVLLWASGAAALTLDEYMASPETYGPVVMLRHALAPGGGDPANFDINDCSTQRNLSEQGRLQARKLGERFLASGFQPARVLTSPWCRCRETAELMAIGKVTDEPGLASFFQNHADRQATLTRLQRVFETVDGLTLMVTHFVVISAVTGHAVGSGEGVVYDPVSKKSWVLQL